MVIDHEVFKSKSENNDCNQIRLQIIVPKKRVPDVLQDLHVESNGANLGIHKPVAKARESLNGFIVCRTEVKNWYKLCEIFLMSKKNLEEGKSQHGNHYQI